MSNIEYLRTQTVLFVEDEELARDVLAKILTKLFKKVITAANGQEGLENFNKEKNTDITKFGITFTKHIGNAVTRNKLKRRIKNIIDTNPKMYNKQTTYIIIAKKTTLDLTYQELERELIYLFNKLKGEKNEEKE